MNKIELQDPATKTIIATRNLATARELLAHGWVHIRTQATVTATKLEVKR